MLSVAQIGRLSSQQRPVAWFLHDAWAFCGAEHYPNGDADTRFVDGYWAHNRPAGEGGLDLNRLTWERKRKHWRRPIHIITPSRWMAKQVRRSALMRSWPLTVIPNALDTKWWGAMPRNVARLKLGIPMSSRVILFGAIGGNSDPRKGADLLRAALPGVAGHLTESFERRIRLMMFGGRSKQDHIAGIDVHSVGALDDEGLRLYYSAADVMVVPSRQEAFGQTASEALACGAPVVAFAIGGLADIIEDGVTGRLVVPYSPDALAEGIAWCIDDSSRQSRLSEAAKQSARQWDFTMVGETLAATLSGLAVQAVHSRRDVE